MSRLYLVLIALCITIISAESTAGDLFHFTQVELTSQDGNGYSAPPYSLNESEIRGEWQSIALPHVVLPQRIDSVTQSDTVGMPTRLSWYRLQVPKISHPSSPSYLYIPRWKADGQLAVYGDGRLLYQSHASMVWNSWNIPLWIPLNGTADTPLPSVIVLRMESPRFFGSGLSSIWVGDEASIGWRYHVRNVLQVQIPLMGSAAFLAVGVFSLFVWSRQKSEVLYLLFFLISVAAFFRCMQYYLGTEYLPISDAWFGWLSVNSLLWIVASVYFFVNQLHQRPIAWLNRVVLAVTLAVSFISVPVYSSAPDMYVLSPFIYVMVILLGGVLAFIGLKKSIVAKSNEASLFAAWALIFMVFGIYDLFMQNNYVSIEGAYLGPYSIVLIFLIFSYILFLRYVGAAKEVVHLNSTLELRLQAREAELAESHRQLRMIEHEQTLSEERRRLVQDMHDGMGSSLVSALRVIEGGQLDTHDVSLVLKDCLDDLKLTIDSMEPLETDLLLLLATLRFRLGNRLENSGVAMRWEVTPVPLLDWLDPRNALHILRILQEAFSNIIKHTNANEIRVTTFVDGGDAVVTISDNGFGYSVEKALKSGGKGLSNQLRRAQAIGAEVSWVSNEKGSTTILRLPIKQSISSTS